MSRVEPLQGGSRASLIALRWVPWTRNVRSNTIRTVRYPTWSFVACRRRLMAAGTPSSGWWVTSCGSVPTSSLTDTTCSPPARSITRPGERRPASVPLTYSFEDDRWYGTLRLDRVGEWRFTVDGWVDRFATWRGELEKKVGAGLDVGSELLEGADSGPRGGASRPRRRSRPARALRRRCSAIRRPDARRGCRRRCPRSSLALMATYGQPYGLTHADREYRVRADPPRGGLRRVVRVLSPVQLRPTPSGTAPSATRSARCRASRRSASTSSTCRRSIRSGAPIARAPTTPWSAAGRSRQSLGDRQRGRRPHGRRIPSSARSTTSAASWTTARVARAGGRARLRAPVLARPPVGAGAPRVVLHPARRHHQVRRESAQEVRGHLPAQLLVRRSGRRCGTRAATSSCSGSSTACASSAWTIRTPSRSRSGNG